MTDQTNELKPRAELQKIEGRRPCPSANGHPYANLDDKCWTVHENGDRVCSFCGSWDPVQLEGFIDGVLAGHQPAYLEFDGIGTRPFRSPVLSVSVNRHKVYVRRMGVDSAADGAIKAYVWHMPQTLAAKINETMALVTEAIQQRENEDAGVPKPVEH